MNTSQQITLEVTKLLIDQEDRQEFLITEMRNSITAIKNLTDQVSMLGKK